jgi:hypothetical protein
MNSLCNRVNVIFNEVVPNASVLILYYKKRNVKGMGAGVFWREAREPRVININLYAWEKIKQRGVVYQFQPNVDFFTSGQTESPKTSDNQIL